MTSRQTNPDEVTFSELLQVLVGDRWLIIGTTTLAVVLALSLVLSLPDLYQSSAMLKPNMPFEPSGLATQQPWSLANVPELVGAQGGPGARTQLALKVLKSTHFLNDFARRHEILPALLAPKRWDVARQTLILDPTIFDERTGAWVSSNARWGGSEPSANAVARGLEALLTARADPATGFVTLAIKHPSPRHANEWLNWLIVDLGESLRVRELAAAESAIDTLRDDLRHANIPEVRIFLATRLWAQLQRQLFAKIETPFAFSIIDPPTVPEQKTEPRRVVLCLVATAFGVFFGAFLSLLRYSWKRARSLAFPPI